MDRRGNGFVEKCFCMPMYVVATNWLQKILKIRRNGVISENMITENPENTPFAGISLKMACGSKMALK